MYRRSQVPPNKHANLSARDFRLMIFYDYSDGVTAPDCIQKLTQLFGSRAPDQATVLKWYERFGAGNFDFDNDEDDETREH